MPKVPVIFPIFSTVVSSRIFFLKHHDHPMVAKIKFGSNSSLMSGLEIFLDISAMSAIIIEVICIL